MSHFIYTTPPPPLTFPFQVPLMFTPKNLEKYLDEFPDHRLLLPEDYFMRDFSQDYYPVEGYCAAEVPRLDLSDLKVREYIKVDFVNGREVIDLTGDDFKVDFVNGREIIDLTGEYFKVDCVNGREVIDLMGE